MKARESSHWKNPWKNNILNVFLLNCQLYMCVVMIFTPLPCIVKLFPFPSKPSIWYNPPMAMPLKKTAHYLHSNHNIILHSYLLLLCVYDCNGPTASGWRCFFPLFPTLQLLHSSYTSPSSMFPSFQEEQSIVTNTQHFDQIWVISHHSAFCRREHLCPRHK